MEERGEQLAKQGVFLSYRQIHEAYTNLGIRDSNIEALKRAVFLQWYSMSEPPCFSGVGDMKEEAECRVFQRLNDLIVEDQIDDELLWMLPYYYSITDYYLDRFDGYEQLKLFSNIPNFRLWADSVPEIDSLQGRGQLSKYWLSLNRLNRAE
jgi:hypothetical protein